VIEVMTVERVVSYILTAQLLRIGKQAKRSERQKMMRFCILVGWKLYKNGLENGMQHKYFMMRQLIAL
jgi:hypothetical protein